MSLRAPLFGWWSAQGPVIRRDSNSQRLSHVVELDVMMDGYGSLSPLHLATDHHPSWRQL
jgi:hypothetical protein